MRRLLIGSPLHSARALHERLPKLVALPVFASDAISSVGYATEEILLALAVAGVAVITGTNISIAIALAIVTLLVIVVTSYRQTIFAYPSGGGSYIVAKDNLGTIPGLTAGAALLILVFKGEVNALIPLYAIGVFLSFTLSQAGMVVHFLRLKERGYRRSAVISAVGATVTAIVVVVQAVTKASEGAWIVLILIPSLVWIFYKIHQHYIVLGNQLRLTEEDTFEPVGHTVLVLTPSIHRGVLQALEYAKTLAADVRAVHVETDPVDTAIMMERWERWGGDIPLVILESPYRSLVIPVLDYLEEAKLERKRHMVTVVIPEFVPAKWWHKLLHNQSGLLLKFALLFRRDIVTTNVRYYVEK